MTNMKEGRVKTLSEKKFNAEKGRSSHIKLNSDLRYQTYLDAQTSAQDNYKKPTFDKSLSGEKPINANLQTHMQNSFSTVNTNPFTPRQKLSKNEFGMFLIP